MILAEILFGARGWIGLTIAAALMFALLLGWAHWQTPAATLWRRVALALKALGVAILCGCLAEPLWTGSRAKPGANQFLVLVDDSQSMTLRDRNEADSRGDQVKSLLADQRDWSVRLAQDFDVRRYSFAGQLRQLRDFADLKFAGGSSSLGSALDRIVRRYDGRALAGILLFTDGRATDLAAVERLLDRGGESGALGLPPIYPVLVGGDRPANDLSLERVAVTQTNFEDAPVTVTARVVGSGYQNRPLMVELLDESKKVCERRPATAGPDGQPIEARFKLRPEKQGVSFYQVRVAAEDEAAALDQPDRSAEATLANNQRMIAVDRGQGPYRVLYVSGRPNWEFKFLRRALEDDREVQFLGLLRIAKREPRFAFRNRAGDSANPLFRGFDVADQEQVEQYDQPVMVRLGAEDASELLGGFPVKPEDLYRYQAVILDDLESEFFTQDQMVLLKNFVRERGGGLLMLGGQESFRNGKYERTPIGDMLPVYLRPPAESRLEGRYRFALAREGWLEPSLRLRSEESEERERLAAMPDFQTLSGASGVKPGATVLATAAVAESAGGSGSPSRDAASQSRLGPGASPQPTLVEQRFGRGRVAALLMGDLWRWELRRRASDDQDFAKAWRQLVRWLLAEVPGRVELRVEPADAERAPEADSLVEQVTLAVTVRDADFAPLDNAAVTVRVSGPDGAAIDLIAEPSNRTPGDYLARYHPRLPGPYRAAATVRAADGSDAGEAETGWTADPAADEFRQLASNKALLERLAKRTNGELVAGSDLNALVATLPTRKVVVAEPYVSPLWHRPWVFLLAIACLSAEWGLRRWSGLP